MPQERALPADAVGGDDCLRNMHALPADAVGGDGGDSEGLRLLVMATQMDHMWAMESDSGVD
jgi:hypothetical protein